MNRKYLIALISYLAYILILTFHAISTLSERPPENVSYENSDDMCALSDYIILEGTWQKLV